LNAVFSNGRIVRDQIGFFPQSGGGDHFETGFFNLFFDQLGGETIRFADGNI
jgi:hypothetical protein